MKLKQVVASMSVAVIWLSGTAQAAPTYSLTNLGTLGGSYSWANGINNSGQVVGESWTLQDVLLGSNSRAFLYSGGSMTDLGTLGGNNSVAFDINNNGQIVGSANDVYGGDLGFLYSSGSMTTPGAQYPSAINDSGQIVGQAYQSLPGGGGMHAYLSSDGIMTDLGTLGGSESSALDINNSGQVVGGSALDSYTKHAFLYSGGVITDLGTLGGSTSYAAGINDSSQIVGASLTAAIDMHAFLYNNGNMTDLGTLGGSQSGAQAINISGQIVGWSQTTGDMGSHAFLYSGGSMIDLNSLVDPDSGWVIESAQGINDSGQIAATGRHLTEGQRALLLSPVPEPETYLMMLAGLGALGVMVRHRKR